jgi:FkbM family methyltransferase
MIFWDVGAHIGEYSLLASRKVGENGRVESFEPHPHLIEFLSHNITSSKFMNVVLHQQAITNYVGLAELVLEPEPSLSHLEPLRHGEGVSPRVTVPTLSLDRFHQQSGDTPHLVKVDVEGVEHLVVEGAKSLLRLPPDTAPVWIMEFASQNCARFGYHPNHLLSEFRHQGYRTFWLTSTGLMDARPAIAPDNVTRNFVAMKNESLLETLTHIAGAA